MTFDELKKQAVTFEKNYKALKEKTEGEVIEWKWSKKQFYSPEPFFYQKDDRRGKPAKLLRIHPKIHQVMCSVVSMQPEK